LKIPHRFGTRFPHPQAIHIHVQHLKALVFGGFFSPQQRFAAISRDGFVRFDAAEAGVFITKVTKTRHQEPFMRRCAGFVAFTARVMRR